ncbi:MAG: hypothetical protein M3P50_04520 [Actinomycetota bacterium]|nr:hypothetical protein [Actinomycetota bacterium]
MTSSEKRGDEPRTGLAAGVFSTGMLAMVVVCCGGHALLLGALGGLAFGSVLGIGGGVLAAVVLVAAVLIIRRRRAAACAFPPNQRSSS